MSEEKRKAGAKPGPLSGLTVIEMAGIGPVPLAGMMLSEMGADVVRVERLSKEQPFLQVPPEFDIDRAGRSIVKVDLKRPEGVALVRRMIAGADVLVEGFRPGVMERLGLGPDEALAANPGLVYGRMTGFGQEGPLSPYAGHDLTYLAYAGVLHAIGPKDGRPVPPLNLVGDYGGGTMFLLSGVLAALFEKSRSGRGQVVDVAMVDGAAMLASPFYGFLATGFWKDSRGVNLLDGGAPFYGTYGTADGQHMAVACLEPQFFAEFVRLLPLDNRYLKMQFDQRCWPEMASEIEARFMERSRDEWAAIFEKTDACVAPVLALKEAPDHPHSQARGGHAQVGSMVRPAPAPRFSRTPGEVSQPPAGAAGVLERFGLSGGEVEGLVSGGVVGG